MENYKIKATVESTNKYETAKLDLLQAMKSFEELTPQEKQQLATELFGAANVAVVCDFLKRYFG